MKSNFWFCIWLHGSFFIILMYLLKRIFFWILKKKDFEKSYWTYTLEIEESNSTFTSGPWSELCQTGLVFLKKWIFKNHLLNKKIFQIWKLVWKFFSGQIPKWWVIRSLESFVPKILLQTQAEKMHLKIFLKAHFWRTLGLFQTFRMSSWTYKSENENSDGTLWSPTFDFVY